MKHVIFSIHDGAAMAYLPPFFMHKEAMALRVFKDCVLSEDHQFAKNPDDYTLFVVGIFNDGNGCIEACSPRSLANGVEFGAEYVPPNVLEKVQ